MPSFSHETSKQIAILRPICVFFMMFVHVSPGFNPALYSGFTLFSGVLIVDILGRASVATLSLVSGFLLASAAVHKSSITLIWSRVRAIYVPMLTWSAIFMLATQAGYLFAGVATAASKSLDGLPMSRIILEKLMFIYGSPASPALGFLRDLTVSSILVILLLRVPRKEVLWVALIGVLALSLYGSMAPLVYRPTILLFMLLGVAMYQMQRSLFVPKVIMVLGAFVLTAVTFQVFVNINAADAGTRDTLTVNALNIAKRASLTVFVLWFGSMLVMTHLGTWLSRIGAHVYLAFLSHTTMLPILWVLWLHVIGNEKHWAYPIFFICAPICTTMFAVLLGRAISSLPASIQIVLRGKAVAAAV